MQEVSEAWKNAHKQTLLPETFVEIEMSVTDGAINNLMSIGFGGEYSEFSEDMFYLVQKSEISNPAYYATLEENLWLLDGTRQVLPDSSPYSTPGYVSKRDPSSSGRLYFCIKMSNIVSTVSPGITITWSSEYGEYPTRFDIVVSKNGEVLNTVNVVGNSSNVSMVEFDLTGYNLIEFFVYDWDFPKHRIRIDRVFLGTSMIFTKEDILSFEHEQTGDVLSATLSRNSISFALDNSDDRWNFNNPTGIGKYLTERQKLTTRYGMDVNGVVEWIPGGTFYLSEWEIPSNGLEARFVARDAFEYLINEHYTHYAHPDFVDVLYRIFDQQSEFLDPVLVVSDISDPTADWDFFGDSTTAEHIQLVANKYQRLVWYNRRNVLNVMPLNKAIRDYPMTLEFAYSHPEITLSKPLKAVAVTGYESTDYESASTKDYTILSVDTKGETQTINNPKMYKWPTDAGKTGELMSYAEWVRDMLIPRKKVSGEFRADPRLDLFDIVEIESKYGVITPVAITTIKYTYNGSFRGYYEGQVIEV